VSRKDRIERDESCRGQDQEPARSVVIPNHHGAKKGGAHEYPLENHREAQKRVGLRNGPGLRSQEKPNRSDQNQVRVQLLVISADPNIEHYQQANDQGHEKVFARVLPFEQHPHSDGRH